MPSRYLSDWLACPECDYRDIDIGPRADDGSVKVACPNCEAEDWLF